MRNGMERVNVTRSAFNSIIYVRNHNNVRMALEQVKRPRLSLKSAIRKHLARALLA